jgi:hypothetical protein
MPHGRISSPSSSECVSVPVEGFLTGVERMEYLIALLTTLALHLPALTGRSVPDMTTLPALELADHLEQAVFAHTGQQPDGKLTTAAYMPRENLILVTAGLLDDLPELEAVLVHELIHWWQARSHPADPRGSTAWEEEARFYENLWRREHGLRMRPTLRPHAPRRS